MTIESSSLRSSQYPASIVMVRRSPRQDQEFRTAILGHIAYQHRTNEAVELATRFQAELDSGAVEYLTSYLASDDSQNAIQRDGHPLRRRAAG